MRIRISILCLLTFLSFTTYSQNKNDFKFYLNSVEHEFSKVHINPETIDSISVEKNSGKRELHIFTKGRIFNALTLTDILKKNTDFTNPNDSILFIIKDKVVYDIDELKIDESFYIYVSVISTSKAKYLDPQFRGISIVIIDLETIERKPQIYIRGQELINKKIIELDK